MEVEEHVKIAAKRSNSFSGVDNSRRGDHCDKPRVRRNSADMNLSTCCQQGSSVKGFSNLFGSSSSRVLFGSFSSRVLRKGVKRKRESVKAFPRNTKKQQIGRSYVFNFPLMNSSTFNQPRGPGCYRQASERTCGVDENAKIALEFPNTAAALEVNTLR